MLAQRPLASPPLRSDRPTAACPGISYCSPLSLTPSPAPPRRLLLQRARRRPPRSKGQPTNEVLFGGVSLSDKARKSMEEMKKQADRGLNVE